MVFKTIKKCKVKDIFYCAERVKTDCWIRTNNQIIFKVYSIRPSMYDHVVILDIRSYISRLDPGNSDLPMEYSEDIELIKPLKEVFAEL